MKKRLLALLLALALVLGTSAAYAVGGSSDDPLITLSYLQNIYKPKLQSALRASLYASTATGQTAAGQVSPTQARYKEGDQLTAGTGSEILVLAGDVTASFSGAVVNASAGSEVEDGETLSANARYIVCEDAAAVFTVTSPTAVVTTSGTVTVESGDAPDYNAMAGALKQLGLLQGTGTGYGDGYDLEKQPTRIEAIVMFIRLLGEEEQALSCTASHPFTDVPTWADRYVAYAYQQGYSNGAGGNKFASSRVITAPEYVEFLLRALRYSSTAHTDLSTTLSDGRTATLLSDKEYELLRNVTLLRAHVVYLSYYALSTPVSGTTTTLAQQLINAGVFSASALESANKSVVTERL